MKKSALALLAFLSTTSVAAQYPPLEVTVTGVKERTGSLRIAIFDSEKSFQKDPYVTLAIPADSDTIQFSLDELAAGELAVMLFHDIDSNEKMKTNMLGIPREPWGASLNGTTLFGPPKWKDVKFVHSDSGTALTIELQ